GKRAWPANPRTQRPADVCLVAMSPSIFLIHWHACEAVAPAELLRAARAPADIPLSAAAATRETLSKSRAAVPAQRLSRIG
ncbi:MAG TPA: hypothetical protein VJA25_07100, partial [Dehalococcoidia bacterium]|nr:hypothetical protein [Dehalococcoidia bacterium]